MLTGEEFWTAVLNDPSGYEKTLHESVRSVHQKMYVQVPAVIAKMLPLPATPANFLRAKIAYMRWAMTTPHLFAEIKAHLIADGNVIEDEKHLKRVTEDEFRKSILAMESRLLHMVDGIGSELRGLNPQARALQKAGELTMESLLRVNPDRFLRGGHTVSTAKVGN